MSHPPETRLTPEQCEEARYALALENELLKETIVGVIRERDAAHRAAIDAAASLVEEHALNMAQRIVAAKIRKLTPADVHKGEPA